MEPAPNPTTPSAVAAATAEPIPAPIRTFLTEPRYATLATIAADGTPHQAVIWYRLEGDDLLLNSRRERHWPRNLLRNPDVSIAVIDAERPFHWVGVKGRAELLRDGDAATEDIQALARWYGKDPSAYLGQDRVTYRVRVDSTFEYGA